MPSDFATIPYRKFDRPYWPRVVDRSAEPDKSGVCQSGGSRKDLLAELQR